MIVGFTGTRKGMTNSQKVDVARILMAWKETWTTDKTWVFVHGGAAGADTEAHDIAIRCGYTVEVRPTPENMGNWINRADVAVVHPPKAPLLRNDDIVRQVEVMIAAPSEDIEQVRGGTWYTIRQARNWNKPHAILKRGT